MPCLKKSPIHTFLMILLALHACNESSPDVHVLDDFENSAVSDIWTGTISISKAFPAHGKRCLELNAQDGQVPWLESEELMKDWSHFEYLKFTIYNPSSRLHYGYIEICDELGTDEQAEFQGQSYNWQNVFLNTGWNHFELLLQNAMVSEGDRPLALDRIRKFRLSFRSMDHSLYLDNLRLVKGEENPRTASRVDPRDCHVTIDDRYVYPRLAGPKEKIKTSPEILQLRKEATAARDQLEKEVQTAELQGYQTLYHRIPLITADIGLRIRSKLVWFQGEKEEKKILEYIHASCTEASREIEVLLSAQKSEVPVPGPEDETTTQAFYVPPHPPFHELKPVYTAFHQHAGTHRVGWDGWCGHLIKDRWAMGGKTKPSLQHHGL